jgi:CRISPR-associated protein Csb1
MADELTLKRLKEAVAGTAAALRCVTEYQPAGGEGDKVFPPTYEGGKYATEKRRLPGVAEPVDCVLLDSVQSQANRMELALLDVWDRQTKDEPFPLPVIVVDFKGNDMPKVLRITSLEAPHRIADALLRDSLLDGQPFRKSPRGKRLGDVDNRNATALFELCPTTLIFGMWDSTGPKGGLGAKFQRAMVSEIVGINMQTGVKTSSRIDPAQIMVGAGPLFRKRTMDGQPGDGWTANPEDAVIKGDLSKDAKVQLLLASKNKKGAWVWHEMNVLRTPDGQPTLTPSKAEQRNNPLTQYRLNNGKGDKDGWIEASAWAGKYPDEGKPSAVNHSNIPPSIDVRKEQGKIVKEPTPAMFLRDNCDFVVYREHHTPSYVGGVTLEKAIQTTVISLPALRRLRFPLNGTYTPAVDDAARTVLAALGLCAATLAREQGCDLRSRCHLHAVAAYEWELLDKPGEKPQKFALTGEDAVKLFKHAVAEATKAGLPWMDKELMLTPSPELVALVKKSQELAAATGGAEEGGE